MILCSCGSEEAPVLFLTASLAWQERVDKAFYVLVHLFLLCKHN